MERELRLMKGNEAVAEAAIRAGADGYFGYPITPQSEILEYLMEANLLKRLEWLSYRQKASLLPSTWFTEVQDVVKKS
jgi:TPP-dependent indolepyruvate ferredoxin oxidoreductase alpha subunit